ncbi:SDR family NAD(P)-dependent oxidoreductase [Candidimonas humi]|uniref:SDR family NAD(P)-dependent oxidoreductase n=1 Tax=Candidimonas humi TaxID=683355 RepID=A0ABV8NXA7_9BURK
MRAASAQAGRRCGNPATCGVSAIVNVSSVSGLRGSYGRTAYGASKGAITTMTSVMANLHMRPWPRSTAAGGAGAERGTARTWTALAVCPCRALWPGGAACKAALRA